MGSLPPGVFLLMVAVLSALAGGLLTWIIVYATGSGRGGAPRGPRLRQDQPETETSTSADLLRVVQTESGPSIFVQGERQHHLRDIEDRETGQETIAAVRAVLAFAEDWLPPLLERLAAAEGATGRPTRDTREVSRQLPSRGPAPVSRADSTSTSRPLQLVDEIDDLLQKRLLERPDLAKRGIRLTRDIEGRPLIYVGTQPYRSADEIPDDDARAFIQETIHVWEKQ